MRRRLRAAPRRLQNAVAAAIETTIDAVHADGLANIDAMTDAKSGRLRDNYRRRLFPKSFRGRVGFLTATARRRVWYAPLVHNGTVNAAARPFHALAVEKHADAHRRRMRAVVRAL